MPTVIPTEEKLTRVSQWPLYQGDNIVRRSEPLQETLLTEQLAVQTNEQTAARLELQNGDYVVVQQHEAIVELPFILTKRLKMIVCLLMPE